jgi:hypothetical protein
MVEDWDHPPAAESVEKLARFVRESDQSCGLKIDGTKSLSSEGVEQLVPAGGTEAEAEFFAVGRIKQALIEEVFLSECLALRGIL